MLLHPDNLNTYQILNAGNILMVESSIKAIENTLKRSKTMSILIKPIITEKMTAASDEFNSYGFVVDRNANKIQIKGAVEDAYGVTVDSVRTMNYLGKSKSRFTKAGVISGRTSHFKKAIVQLAEGDTIDFYSNI